MRAALFGRAEHRLQPHQNSSTSDGSSSCGCWMRRWGTVGGGVLDSLQVGQEGAHYFFCTLSDLTNTLASSSPLSCNVAVIFSPLPSPSSTSSRLPPSACADHSFPQLSPDAYHDTCLPFDARFPRLWRGVVFMEVRQLPLFLSPPHLVLIETCTFRTSRPLTRASCS